MADAPIAVDGLESFELIGRGGFSRVYKARQPRLNRDVAVKVLDPRTDVDSQRLFERECQIAGSLGRHPNIITILDSGIDAHQTPWIVTPFYRRGSLDTQLRASGPMPEREALGVAGKVADALAEAHEAHIVHRDVKPENVLLTDFGEPVLSDFGISRAVNATATTSGLTLTIAHAAPEVLEGQVATDRADVYSLGSTLYTLLTGAPPFDRGGDANLGAILLRVMRDPVPDLRARGVSDAAATLVEQMMAKSPSDRPSTREVAARAHQLIGGTLPLPVANPSSGAGATVLVPPAAPAATAHTPPVGTTAAPAPAGVTEAVAARSGSGARPTRRIVAVGAGAAVAIAGAVGLLVSRRGGDGSAVAAETTLAVTGSGPVVSEPVVTEAPLVTDAPTTVAPDTEPASTEPATTAAPAAVAVPDVMGASEASATAAITDAGLVPQVTHDSSSTMAKGHVVRQQPPSGRSVQPGATVILVVSDGPPQPAPTEAPATAAPTTARPVTTGRPPTTAAPATAAPATDAAVLDPGGDGVLGVDLSSLTVYTGRVSGTLGADGTKNRPTEGFVSVRGKPWGRELRRIREGEEVRFVCQVRSPRSVVSDANGQSDVWDRLVTGGYVAHVYVADSGLDATTLSVPCSALRKKS